MYPGSARDLHTQSQFNVLLNQIFLFTGLTNPNPVKRNSEVTERTLKFKKKKFFFERCI